MNHSLLNLLERLFGSSKKENGDYYSFYSPFVEHHNPKLNINLENGKWKCWKSGIYGNSIKSLLTRLKVEDKYLKELKLVQPTTTSNKVSYIHHSKNELKLPDEFIPLYKKRDNFLQEKAYNYLIHNRKLTLYDIIYYNIGFCCTGEYKNHIIIPSYDVHYNLNYYVARDVNLKGRYKNVKSTNVKQSDIIFFESNIDYNLPINITEGVFDAISLKRNTIPLLGKNIYQSFILKLLQNNVVEVNLYLDNDTTFNENEKIYQKLHSYGIKCNVYHLPGKDVNDIGYNNTIQYSDKLEMSFENKIKGNLINAKL
jgi:DNA primase